MRDAHKYPRATVVELLRGPKKLTQPDQFLGTPQQRMRNSVLCTELGGDVQKHDAASRVGVVVLALDACSQNSTPPSESSMTYSVSMFTLRSNLMLLRINQEFFSVI